MTHRGMAFQTFADTFPLYKHAQEGSYDIAESCANRCQVDMLNEQGISQDHNLCLQRCYVKYFDAFTTLKYQIEFRSESIENLT